MHANVCGWSRAAARLASLAALTWPAPALAQTASSGEGDAKRECAAQHEQAQVQRHEGRLIETLAALRVCSQQVCPAAVREDCVQWYDEVSRSIPSVVITARTGDVDQIDVRVFIDGKLARSQLDGQPMQLNPGAHLFRFECKGFEPVERRVLLAPGEKLRTIAVAFPLPVQASEQDADVSLAEEPPLASGSGQPPKAKSRSSIPPLAYVAAGTALVGAAGFAAFGLWGLDQRSELQSTCRPACDGSKVDSARVKFLLADVSLGLSVAAAVTAGVLYFTRPAALPAVEKSGAKRRPRLTSPWSASLELEPAGGAWMRMKGTF